LLVYSDNKNNRYSYSLYIPVFPYARYHEVCALEQGMYMVTILEKPERRLEVPRRKNRWGFVSWSVLAAAFLYLYAPVLAYLVVNWWDDPDYSHGFLVPVLSAYFVWKRRQKLSDTVSRANRWGILVLLMGICMLFLGNIGAELFLMRFSMIIVIAGLVLYLLGWRHLQMLAFPIVFLLFMIPPPAIILNAVTFPLQLLAAKMSTFSLQLINLPVYREGNVIFLPYVTLEIVEACSGLRSLISLMMLSVVFAYLTQRRIWKAIVLIISSVPIALIANAFRIFGTGVLAHLYGTKVAEGFYHTFAGWSIFIVAFGLLVVEGFILSRFRSGCALQE
jgi:exosortase